MSPLLKRYSGVVLPLVLISGGVLLTLGLTLYNFVSQQNSNIHLLASAEVAHFLAEAGISSCVRTVRETLSRANLTANPQVAGLLLQGRPLPDTSLMSYLKDTWNEDLKGFAREVDSTAGIKVEVWLREFKQTETAPESWVDPSAKTGWLSIESTGEYRGMRRTLSVKRQVWVGSILPPVVSKFTLHVGQASRGNEGSYNIIRNDYAGNITDGPLPIICYNHGTPDTFFPFEGRPLSAILNEEKNPQIYQQRGWIWLGGGKVRLNLTSGAGALGEIFHFFEILSNSTFQAIKFITLTAKLPPPFRSPQSLPWDIKPDDPNPPWYSYTFGHHFVLEGFHDKSDRKAQNAMYEGDILSVAAELPRYGAKSSMLHLYGTSNKGYQSRTKVLGNVSLAFPRFAGLDITPQEPIQRANFLSAAPPPMYLLPSLFPHEYSEERLLTDFLKRRLGGPILPVGFLFADQSMYSRFMSCIVEMPYVTSYNAMQDIQTGQPPREFPPQNKILSEDDGREITLTRNNQILYKGPVSAPQLLEVIHRRVQKKIGSIEEFWTTYYDADKQTLNLNEIVQIDNAAKASFLIPPDNLPYPLKVTGGGMVILAEGNLVLRGVQMQSPKEALTLVLDKGTLVKFETPIQNQLNIVAPKAELDYGSKMDLLGTLCLGTVRPDERTSGGFLRYRQEQDPTTDESQAFTKIRINNRDTFWHE